MVLNIKIIKEKKGKLSEIRKENLIRAQRTGFSNVNN